MKAVAHFHGGPRDGDTMEIEEASYSIEVFHGAFLGSGAKHTAPEIVTYWRGKWPLKEGEVEEWEYVYMTEGRDS